MLGLAIYFVVVFVRAFCWQMFLNPFKHLSIDKLFSEVCIGYRGNKIYPAGAGEILRSILLKSEESVDISGSLARIVVECLFDVIAILGRVLLNLGQLIGMPGYNSVGLFGRHLLCR
jgi:hypothetical protein